MALNPFTRSISEGPSVVVGPERAAMAANGRGAPVWLLAHPTMEEVAQRVVERCTHSRAKLSAVRFIQGISSLRAI